jgi:hypothetical protein
MAKERNSPSSKKNERPVVPNSEKAASDGQVKVRK